MVQSSTLLVLIERQPVVPSVTYVLYVRMATLVIWVIALQKFTLLRLKHIHCLTAWAQFVYPLSYQVCKSSYIGLFIYNHAFWLNKRHIYTVMWSCITELGLQALHHSLTCAPITYSHQIPLALHWNPTGLSDGESHIINKQDWLCDVGVGVWSLCVQLIFVPHCVCIGLWSLCVTLNCAVHCVCIYLCVTGHDLQPQLEVDSSDVEPVSVSDWGLDYELKLNTKTKLSVGRTAIAESSLKVNGKLCIFAAVPIS